MFSGLPPSTSIRNLIPNEVHLWYFNINEALQNYTVSGVCKLLNKEERSRMMGYRTEKRRNLFIASRGALRLILSSLLQEKSPDAIKLSFNKNGKPFLDDVSSQIQFNLSHSHDCVVIGVTKNSAIGVDIELMQARSTMIDIAEHYFHHCELKAINNALNTEGNASALRLFYKIWSLKEAFIKADGRGMDIAGTSFYFKNCHQNNPLIEFEDYAPDVPQRWCFEHQVIYKQYSVALALKTVASKERILVSNQRFTF